uniref:Uncharacterized protein n=1 Tax=Heterorhabditis bacteriophora TaxID=37862 RepID=A0A1I7WLN0_HETBA
MVCNNVLLSQKVVYGKMMYGFIHRMLMSQSSTSLIRYANSNAIYTYIYFR